MTAVTSSKKNSFFGTRYLSNISGNKKQLIINIVLEILGLPVLSVIAVIGFYFENKDLTLAEQVIQDNVMNACIPFAVLAIVTIAVSILMGIIIALFHFPYLYKKTIVDMHYSLPLSSTQRFFADYLSGLTIYIVPALGAIVLSLIISGIGSIFVDMSAFWKYVPIILKLCFIVIVTMIQIYSISVFAITFCGSTFESIFGIFAFMCMIPATIGCVWLAIVETSGFGMTDDAIFMNNIFTSTSPFGAFIFFANYIAETTYLGDNGFQYYTSLYIKWILITFLFNIIYTGVAYLLYRFRKAEDVSKPYVYKAYFYAIMTMAVFCILSLFITFNGFVVAGIVICAVGWFIMEVITRRGFKKFWTAPIGFAIAVVSVFAVCQVCKVTDGFGASKHIPSAISIENVKITNYNIGYYDISFKDKDVIKSAVELNKEIVDRHFNPDNYTYEPISDDDAVLSYYSDDSDITIEYSTITGTTVKRRYTVNTGMLDNLTKAILLSDEYARYSASQIGTTNNIYDSSSEGLVINRYSISISDKLKSNSNNRTITSKQMEEIRQAYVKDMQNMTEDDLINRDIYCFIDNYWVLESFENTIDVLDADIEPVSEDTVRSAVIPMIIEPVIETFVKSYMENDNGSGYYYYEVMDKETTKAETITTVYPKINTYDLTGIQVSLLTNNDDVIELLDRFTSIIIGEKPLAIIRINNSVFFLPDRNDNAELLEKVTENSKKTRTTSETKTS